MTQELHGVISLGGTVIGGSLNQRGLKGETGNGIESVVMTEEYNLVITYTDGDVVTLDTGLDDYEELLKGYKDDAESAKSDAESAKSDAESAKTDAVDAKNDAVSAKNDAVSAKNDAESAKSDAVSAKNDAVSAKTDAQSAKTAAETAQGKAEDAQGYAETAQTAAETAATNANTYQGWAQNYASNAQTQAGYASTHRWAAYDSQVAAAASALVSEGYANGEQNGTPVTSGSPYYHNNAKYYSEQFVRAFPTDTASGAIASFEDGSDLFDYLSCIVDIDPVQDLHGYDKPWVGGAGANKWDEDWELGYITASTGGNSSSATEIRSKNYIPVSPSTTYYAYTGNQTGTQRMAFYDSSKTYLGNGSGGWAVLPSNGTFATPADAYYMRFYVQGNTYGNNIAINYPSSVTTYSPWENLCPITGWTECEVSQAGVNLANFVDGYTVDAQGQVTPIANRCATVNPIKIDANETYYVKSFGTAFFIYAVFNGNTLVRRTAGIASGVALDTSGGDKLYVCAYDGTVDTTLPMVTKGSVATDYTPYNGTTYPVSWQTEAGTVYGGSIDVVSGALTVDRASVDLGSLSWTYDNTSYAYGFFTSSVLSNRKPGSLENAICSNYTVNNGGRYSMGNGTGQIASFNETNANAVCVRDDNYINATTFTTAMNGVQLVYELATPQTYQLDPVQVACLFGQNNVWADCGSIEEVQYKADVQKWVEKQLREINTAILALS